MLIAGSDLTQQQVADAVGMNRQAFNQLLQKDDMRISVLLAALDLMCVSPCDFFEEPDAQRDTSRAPLEAELRARLLDKQRIIDLQADQLAHYRRQTS